MRPAVLAFVGGCALVSGCNNSTAYTDPAFQPDIVTATGPAGGVVVCDPAAVGGNCGLPLAVTFKLAKGEFVWKANVRFHGDGSDNGVDHGYELPNTFGNDDVGVVVNVSASVPSTILRRDAFFTYEVRLVSGMGVESLPSTLTIQIQ